MLDHGLPLDAVQKIYSIFQQHPKIDNVILYGSRAIGTYKKGSDIDLCIESSALGLTELLTIESQLDDLLLPWKIDLSLRSAIDNPDLLSHISKMGMVFYP